MTLSPRQLQVVKALAGGMTQAQFADQNGLARTTVNGYVDKAKQKARVETVEQLVKWWKAREPTPPTP